ncbi:hypothetical protein SAY87_026591 [Trapa incisa]|uniref:Thioredoxin domain-containing protein n=2 Tax=Trapa TaxID=22665 RepID=A0AAN7M0S6_TRANT|nr:hypothetical protein SAY87_026591 [Trapa incisa]KAK4800143.1 hypothetical protein SAY86_025508 [Trapa natans]
MAISLSAAMIPLSMSEQSVCSSASAMFSSLSSLQFRFPANSGKVGGIAQRISPSSRARTAAIIVQAKKQTYSSLDDLLAQSDKPVLVDFYATWCGPCQFMVPILNEVSNALKNKIRVVKIDTEKYPSIANQYAIEALPTLILFKHGKPYNRFEGALTAKQLIEWIEESLKVKN